MSSKLIFNSLSSFWKSTGWPQLPTL
jgi:hypothetical protein